MSKHKRSRFNQFLDRCPTWVQEEVWGENGLRATIETLEARVRELESELSDLIPEFNCQCGHPCCSIERTKRGILKVLNKTETKDHE